MFILKNEVIANENKVQNIRLRPINSSVCVFINSEIEGDKIEALFNPLTIIK